MMKILILPPLEMKPMHVRNFVRAWLDHEQSYRNTFWIIWSAPTHYEQKSRCANQWWGLADRMGYVSDDRADVVRYVHELVELNHYV